MSKLTEKYKMEVLSWPPVQNRHTLACGVQVWWSSLQEVFVLENHTLFVCLVAVHRSSHWPLPCKAKLANLGTRRCLHITSYFCLNRFMTFCVCFFIKLCTEWSRNFFFLVDSYIMLRLFFPINLQLIIQDHRHYAGVFKY